MIRYLLTAFIMSCHLLSAEIIFNQQACATHQPILYQMAIRTTGAIVEFGCGNSSTDMLHEICRKEKRILVSIDDDYAWIQKFKDKYLHDGYEEDNSGWHKFFYVAKKNVNTDLIAQDASYWQEFLDNNELLQCLPIDLCFVDQSPWEARTITVNHFKNKAKYIILHDCDYFTAGQLGCMNRHRPGRFDFSQTFLHFKVFLPKNPWPSRTGPPTLLGSNLEELPFDIVSQ